MKNITIRSSLLMVLLTFAAMVVVGAAVGLVALNHANNNAQRLDQMAQQMQSINAAYTESVVARGALDRAYAALKDHADGVTNTALSDAQAAMDRGAADTKAVAAAASSIPADSALRQNLAAAASQLSDSLSSAQASLRSGDATGYAGNTAPAVVSDAAHYADSVDAMRRFGMAAMNATLSQSHLYFGWVVAMVVVGVAAALALTLATFFALRRIVVNPLKEAVTALDRIAANNLSELIHDGGNNEVGQLFHAMRRMQIGLSGTVLNVRRNCDVIDTGAREIAVGNADLASRTEEQSAALEETAAAMEQLMATVKQNADNAKEASSLAANASDIALRNGRVVGEAVSTMDAVSTSSARIADITGLIDSIAFQTNILALNAAVEAARAGENGRGFAVVASEVRALAQRSAGAAKDIKTLIEKSVRDVQRGNELVGQAGNTMHEIVDVVGKVASLMGAIRAAAVEQSTGIDQVGLAVGQMDQVTQQNAALVEQASAAASSLEQQAKQMVEAVAVFQLNATAAERGERKAGAGY